MDRRKHGSEGCELGNLDVKQIWGKKRTKERLGFERLTPREEGMVRMGERLVEL